MKVKRTLIVEMRTRVSIGCAAGSTRPVRASHRRAEPAFWGKGHAGQELGINPETDKIPIKFGYRTYRGVIPV